MPLSNVNLGDNSREGDIATAEDGFEQCISLMNCLSPRLRVLLLRDPSWDKNPMECDRAHRIIAQAVQRFEQNLPSLIKLDLGHIYHHPQSNDGFEWIVTPEVFLNMHPLVHLRWVTDCDASGAEGSVPHPPPTNDHLVALRQKHGHTLRQLIMQYATWLDETSEPATLGFTRDDAAIFLKNLDLVKVVLTVPHLDLYLVWTTPKAKLEALRSIGISP
ncbi:hypothetical protein CPSG_01234 [Coccidioides posadasii str. Silveira]|uniref:Uncharacterized protein n=2 Tax=Coccidioides posadasii TaxID=199306 RepID=E9CRW0_COCPS|nr:hypothetical protein CPSG_01234 [Coccidioides posadasii str. Silveira]KMM68203.1 hypothetical protein CPAG_04534 [Coccidioides posadasii RMSCC 3488]